MELIQFRKKRRRVKKGVLAIILGFLAAVALILLGILIFGGAEETSKQGAINGAKVYSAVILRSEKVVITKECVSGSEPPKIIHRPKPTISPEIINAS